MGKIKLPSQVGAFIGGASVVGGAIAVAGLGGGAFVLHKIQQRQQRTSNKNAAMQHALEKLVWLQAGKNSYMSVSVIHSQAAAAERAATDAQAQHAKQVQQLEGNVQRLQEKVEGLEGRTNGLESQVSHLGDEVKAEKERAGSAHAALVKAQQKKDDEFEEMLKRNASLEETVKQLRNKLEAGPARCPLNQLEERIATGKDGPSGGFQVAAGAGEAIAAHYPAQVGDMTQPAAEPGASDSQADNGSNNSSSSSSHPSSHPLVKAVPSQPLPGANAGKPDMAGAGKDAAKPDMAGAGKDAAKKTPFGFMNAGDLAFDLQGSSVSKDGLPDNVKPGDAVGLPQGPTAKPPSGPSPSKAGASIGLPVAATAEQVDLSAKAAGIPDTYVPNSPAVAAVDMSKSPQENLQRAQAPPQRSFADELWGAAESDSRGWCLGSSDPPGNADNKTSKPELDIPVSAGNLQQAGGSASSLAEQTDELSARPATSVATSAAVAAAEELQQVDAKPKASFVDAMWGTEDASHAKLGWGAISSGTPGNKTSKPELDIPVSAASLQQTKRMKGPANQDAYKQELASSLRRGASLGDCADDTARQVSLGPDAAAQGLTALGLLTAWDEASKVVTPYKRLVELSQQGFLPGNPQVEVPGPAVRETKTCVVPFWTKADDLHIFVPGWGDVNASNCEALMAVLPEEHKGAVNKLDLSLVLLRAAYVVYVNSKLLPWMHRGQDLNMSACLLTKGSLPPTASEACGVVRGVYHRSTDSSSLDALLAEAGAANPGITFCEGPDQPEADALVEGHKWQDMSVEQQQAYLDEEGTINHLCAGSCGKRWRGSNNGATGPPQDPVEKVVVLRCPTCRRISQNKGGDLPMCEECAARCCRLQECRRKHGLGQRNSRHRHLPYFALESCINLA